ncbi:MAG: FadR family transcriptional regulator [Anaerolineales bacterium]|nr:FadR family transcriptional regulator [Anaerolineales bacterium]
MADSTARVTFEAFEKEVLPNRIVESLLNLIREKKLLPGDKFPPERELAQLMNVGRPALREALRALSVMNIIEVRPGSGAYVSQLQPEKLVEHLEFVFSLDDPSIFHLFDARKTLELHTVTIAVQQITDEEIARLEYYLAQMIANERNSATCDEFDREFHKTIAATTRNPFFFQFVSVVNQLGTQSRRLSYSLPCALTETFREHRAIIDALKAHDPDLAKQAMLYHLDRAELHLRQLLSGESPCSDEEPAEEILVN